MAEMRIEVENGRQVRYDMARAEKIITQEVQDDAIGEFADDLKEEIVRTAPVRTGTYARSWEVVEVDDGYLIVNDTPYGKYLVFPNSRMVGSRKADDPGRGVLHNVRGIAFRERSTFRDKIKNKIRGLLSGF